MCVFDLRPLILPDPVTGVGFSPDPDDFTGGTMQLEVGEEINCTASGRPEPQMRSVQGQATVKRSDV